MSKELDKVRGVNVNNQYNGKELDVFSKMLFSTFKDPISHRYYELVDSNGHIVQIVVSDTKSVVQSAAARMGLDYRLVEFDETFEDLNRQEDDVRHDVKE
jgi:hypothetical protein